MDCVVAREEMLEAAPDELAGIAPTALAEHLRSCTRCNPIARLLIAEQARLGTALSLVQPSLTSEAAAARVLASHSVATYRLTRGERIRRFAAAAFPMATAAALAAYVVYGERDPAPYTASVMEVVATAVRITAPPGRGTIVLVTKDPDITFAWFGEELSP